MKRFALCVFLALAAIAAADKVVLKDGRTYDGIVIEETDQSVRIKTSKAVMTFPRDQVASIEHSPVGPLQEREVRLAALDPAKPAEYLATAKWLAGPGREAFELSALRQLCTIASKLDRTQAWEAQMLLAKETEAAGFTREAGSCLARAEFAKPGDTETRARLEAVRTVLMTPARSEMDHLRMALELVIDENYKDALPRLREARQGAMSERASDLAGMTMEELIRAVLRKVKCATCKGEGGVTCPVCEGRKESDCTACGGTGTKKDYVQKGGVANLAESACHTCFGLGKFLCQRCHAERDLIIYLVAAPTQYTITLVGGSEIESLKKEIDLKRYVHVGVKVTMLGAGPPKSGGLLPCKDCEGFKFDPTFPKPPMDKVKAFRDEIAACLSGAKTYDPIPAADKAWDPALIADELFRYRNGKWTR